MASSLGGFLGNRSSRIDPSPIPAVPPSRHRGIISIRRQTPLRQAQAVVGGVH